jgi:hypothetical protein
MRHARTRGRNGIRHRCLHPYRWARLGGEACPVDGGKAGGWGESRTAYLMPVDLYLACILNFAETYLRLFCSLSCGMKSN